MAGLEGVKAIQTRYLGPTATRGSRMKAWAKDCGSLTISFNNEWTDCRNHEEVCDAFKSAMAMNSGSPNWHGPMVGGTLPNGDMAWVFTGE